MSTPVSLTAEIVIGPAVARPPYPRGCYVVSDGHAECDAVEAFGTHASRSEPLAGRTDVVGCGQVTMVLEFRETGTPL